MPLARACRAWVGLCAACAAIVGCAPEGPAPAQRVEIRLVVFPDGETAVPLLDGGEVLFEWGAQGGTMIRPAVILPPGTAEPRALWRMSLRHQPDPAAPEAFGEASAFPELVVETITWRIGPDLVVGPLDDQLGWMDLTGTRLILDATVEGPGLWGQASVRLHITGELTERPR